MWFMGQNKGNTNTSKGSYKISQLWSPHQKKVRNRWMWKLTWTSWWRLSSRMNFHFLSSHVGWRCGIGKKNKERSWVIWLVWHRAIEVNAWRGQVNTRISHKYINIAIVKQARETTLHWVWDCDLTQLSWDFVTNILNIYICGRSGPTGSMEKTHSTNDNIWT